MKPSDFQNAQVGTEKKHYDMVEFLVRTINRVLFFSCPYRKPFALYMFSCLDFSNLLHNYRGSFRGALPHNVTDIPHKSIADVFLQGLIEKMLSHETSVGLTK